MPQPHSGSIHRFFLRGLLVCAAIVLAGHHHYGEAHSDCGESEAHTIQLQAAQVCRGFIVLPNGATALSGLPASLAPGSTGVQQQAAQTAATMAAPGATSEAPQPLPGYTHGQETVPPAGMLCVPISDAGTLQWTAVGHKAGPTVTVEALTDALTHDRRTNAALAFTFAFTVRHRRAFVNAAHVRLLTRMPHHDQRMPGGHAPVHNSEVQNLVAQPVGQGRYIMPTVELSMGGLWLFEIHVQQDSETYTAYFATYVSDE